MLIAPSLLSADFSKLGEEIKNLEKAGADWIHWDIMDGHFVSQLTFGPLILKKLRPLTKLPFDVHLMVESPENLIEEFVQAGADHITCHIETLSDPMKTIKHIQSFQVKAGLTLRPSTAIESLFPFQEALDLILVMTVEPGRSGQAFLPEQAEKVRLLKKWDKETQL